MIIKVCGMGNTEIMHELTALQIDMLGFIFYPPSPRYIVGKINPSELKKLPSDKKNIGVFVNAEIDFILEQSEMYNLNGIQLHGSESPELCKSLNEYGYLVMKAFNLTKNNDYEAYAPYCDFFLFDTPSEKHGGTGEKFDWSLLDKYTMDTPFLLSGGIGPEDAKEVLQIKHPKLAGIDINSKFEVKPGIKDVNSVHNFVNEIRNN